MPYPHGRKHTSTSATRTPQASTNLNPGTEKCSEDARPRALSGSHRRVLFEESGIAPEVVAERGTFTARRGKDVPQDHGRLPSKPGMVFPVHTLEGDIFHRLRPDNPGRGGKYLQPKDAPNRLDVHPRQHERAKLPGGMRYVTEGERKVDSGVSHGLLMVGQAGVFNGQRDKGAALIADWDLLPIEGEKYSICYDSDIESNPLVQLAADRLARLLRERGANVFITLLPPAPNGSKQGIDDFLANGGTVKEVELLTRPYEPLAIERARLSRDERLRASVRYLRRRWREGDWMHFKGSAQRGNWARGYTAYDTMHALIALAARSGKADGRGVVVQAGLRKLSDMAAKSAPSVGKALAHLQADGQIEILPSEDRTQPRRYRLLVPRATLYSMERGNGGEGKLEEGDPGCKGLRAPTAPRLPWSSPGRPRRRAFELVPGRGVVRSTGRVPRNAVAEDLLPTPYVKRLGPHRCAIIDALEVAGGELALAELCEVLRRSRPRDVRRRLLPMLEGAGIIECEGDVVRLAEDWIVRLEDERRRKGEIFQAEAKVKRHREESERYRAYLRSVRHKPSAAGLAAVERSRQKRAEHIAEHEEHQAKARAAELESKRFVKRFVRDRVKSLGRIRLELLQEILKDAGAMPGYALPAAKSLGCTVEKLPEFGNEEFIFAPREWRAA